MINIFDIIRTYLRIPSQILIWVQVGIMVGAFYSLFSFLFAVYNLLTSFLVSYNTESAIMQKVFCFLSHLGFFEGILMGLPVLITTLTYIFAYKMAKGSIGFIKESSWILRN